MLFKNRIRNKANKMFDDLIVDPSFIKHNSPKNKTPFINVLAPALSAAVCVLLIGGVTTSLVLINRNNKNQGLGLNQIMERAMVLDNQNQVLREFESNASFIFGGNITRKNEDGKAVDIDNSLVEVDSSQFQEGVVGNYTINCRLKSDNNALVSYNVVVNEDVIREIAVVSKKSVYYLNEPILPSDVEVFKIMEDGKTVRALPTEVGINDMCYDASKVGTYPISVYLQTNKKIKLTYNVEVKPLEEISLKGDYAYQIEDNRVGSPIVHAFSIDKTIKSKVSDVIMDGDYTTSFIDKDRGQVVIKNGHYGQAMTYIPETREMVVSGLNGEPDKRCFLVSDRDAFYTVKGGEDNLTYVARDGYISKKALDYFDLTYGGLYKDDELRNKVTSLDHFYDEISLYLGKSRHISSDKGYIGDWYLESDMNKMKMTINEVNLGEYGNTNRNYEVDETKEEVIITSGNQLYVYDKYQGALYATDNNGQRTLRYKKYDANSEAVCKIYYNNAGDYESIVYQLGETLSKRFVSDNRLDYVVVSSVVDENGEREYHDEQIIGNMTVKGTFGHRYMDSLIGKYNGNYLSYWEITDKFGADRMDDNSDHRFYLQRVEMGEVTRTGWFHFTEATREKYKVPYVNSHGEYAYDENGLVRYHETTLTVYKAYAHFEDHAVLAARVHFTRVMDFVTGKDSDIIAINFGNGSDYKISEIWGKMPFIGQYASDNDKTIKVDKDAVMYEYNANQLVATINGAVTNYSKDLTKVSCYEKGANEERVNSEVEFKLIGGRYQFERNGKTYIQQI